jgi:hypothetical protein
VPVFAQIPRGIRQRRSAKVQTKTENQKLRIQQKSGIFYLIELLLT